MQEAMFFCQECGAANTDTASYCFACKQPLSPSSSWAANSAPAAVFTSIPVGNGAFVHKLAEPQMAPVQLAAGPLPAGFLLAGRYRIVKQVGQGGFGVVYKAKDRRRRNKVVAIKQIDLASLSARDKIQATDSYNREIKLMPSLRHKNLPRFHAHFTDREHWYLVMDFVEGETLEEYLQRMPDGKLPMKEVLTIGAQLCDVLSYLHEKHNIIFRDIKPANVMRTRKGGLYLIDFGIARRFVPGKAKDTIPLGSPGYAAPEQYGIQQSSVRSDIYGLGATLLALLTGVDPVETTGQLADAAPVAVLPPRLQELLDQMLTWDASQRPKNTGIVKKRLLIERDGMLVRTAVRLLPVLIGVFAGALPYFLALLSLLRLNSDIALDSVTCIVPLLGGGEFITSLCFLFFERKRVIGLSMLVTLILLLCLALSGHLWLPHFVN